MPRPCGRGAPAEYAHICFYLSLMYLSMCIAGVCVYNFFYYSEHRNASTYIKEALLARRARAGAARQKFMLTYALCSYVSFLLF